MKLEKTLWRLNHDGYWDKPVDDTHYTKRDSLKTFDQNGYALCGLEREHAKTNNYEAQLGQHQVGEWSIRLPWYWQTDQQYGAHLNHAILVERKGYTDEALRRLNDFTYVNPLIWKMIKMKPKWGIDISVDYVDDDGVVFEVFHHEWDSFNFTEVIDMKCIIEEFVELADFEDIAKKLWNKRDEWTHLSYDKMSEYKCDFVGVPRERYKMANWHDG